MRQFEGYKKGVNLGGWLSQCGNNYTTEHYETFIVEKDIEKIASWGADHVRMPVDYNVIQNEDGSLKEEGFKYIDNCIEWVQKYKLNLVFDLHKAMGYVFDDKEYCNFFYEEKLQDHFVYLWTEIVKKYGKYSDFITFELLNEVTMPEVATKWNEIAARTISEIRKINKDVRIMIGGIFNSSIYGMTLLDPPADENIVFTFHCYSPLIFTHQGASWVENMPLEKEKYEMHYPDTVAEYSKRSKEVFGDDYEDEFEGLTCEKMSPEYFERLMSRAIETGKKYNVPLYCGEYGVIELAEVEDQMKWYQDMHAALEKYDIARAAWSYKQMDFGLSDKRLEPVIDELIKYL